jgi:hypothetical protein
MSRHPGTRRARAARRVRAALVVAGLIVGSVMLPASGQEAPRTAHAGRYALPVSLRLTTPTLVVIHAVSPHSPVLARTYVGVDAVNRASVLMRLPLYRGTPQLDKFLYRDGDSDYVADAYASNTTVGGCSTADACQTAFQTQTFTTHASATTFDASADWSLVLGADASDLVISAEAKTSSYGQGWVADVLPGRFHYTRGETASSVGVRLGVFATDIKSAEHFTGTAIGGGPRGSLALSFIPCDNQTGPGGTPLPGTGSATLSGGPSKIPLGCAAGQARSALAYTGRATVWRLSGDVVGFSKTTTRLAVVDLP